MGLPRMQQCRILYAIWWFFDARMRHGQVRDHQRDEKSRAAENAREGAKVTKIPLDADVAARTQRAYSHKERRCDPGQKQDKPGHRRHEPKPRHAPLVARRPCRQESPSQSIPRTIGETQNRNDR